MTLLLLLGRHTVARRSSISSSPKFAAFFSTALADCAAARPHLRRSWWQAAAPQPREAAAAAGLGALLRPVGWRIACGTQGGLVQAWSQQHRTVWGSGRECARSWTEKSVARWRPTARSAWSGFRSSRSRHFGGGSYVDPQLALGALIATNVAVFFMWRSVGGRFMQSNFVLSAQALREGRLHTLVTNTFSQQTLQHLLSNMIGLYFFGTEIGNLFGGQRLVLLYLAGGFVGSVAHLAYWAYVMPGVKGYPKGMSWRSPGLLGSSGAVNAIILVDILLFPTRILYLNFIIPVPAALLGVGIIGADLWAARDGSGNGTSPAAHLGGALVGLLAWLRWR